MAFNLVEDGTIAVVGIASGALTKMAPVNIMGTNVGVDAIAEGAALVGGAALQFLMPGTLPNVADGLFDSGLALMARRGTIHLMNQTTAAGWAGGAPYRVGAATYGNAHAASASGLARGQSSSVTGLRQVRFS